MFGALYVIKIRKRLNIESTIYVANNTHLISPTLPKMIERRLRFK